MKNRIAFAVGILVSALLLAVHTAAAQGTAFTYQGELKDAGQPAQGTYDLRFALYDSTNDPGRLIAGPVTNTGTFVSDGRFTVTLDFSAAVFAGAPRWLQVDVRTNGGNGFVALSPRQPLTSVPYALFAATSSNVVGLLTTAQVSNSIPPVITNSVTQTAVGATIGAADGHALTNLNLAVATNAIDTGSFSFGAGNYTTNVSGNLILGAFGNVSVDRYECFIMRVVPSGGDCTVTLPPNVHCKGAEFVGQVAFATNKLELELFIEHWAQEKTNALSVTIP